MIETFISYLRSVMLVHDRAMVTVANHEFYVDPKDLRAAAVDELRKHAAAWVVIAREGAASWAVPLLPEVTIDNLFFAMEFSFLLNFNLEDCLVMIGDHVLTIRQGNGFVHHGKHGFLLRRTREEAEEICRLATPPLW